MSDKVELCCIYTKQPVYCKELQGAAPSFLAHLLLLLFVCVFVCRDLDQASMEAVVSLLAGLPLQPEEGDGVELMEAKSQLFLKYVAITPKI